MTHPQQLLGRAVAYGRRHGLRAMPGRMWLALKRCVGGNRMVLFQCDPTSAPDSSLEQTGAAAMERISSAAELSPQDRARIASAWNPEIAERLHAERFRLGASLWLFKVDGTVAAYGWTIRQATMEPHYFPLGPNDAHLFDFYVFPEFRGRRINPQLVNHILCKLAGENISRAFIEVAEWNAPQLSSIRRTPFRKIGLARKSLIFGKTIVVWSAE